MMLLAILLSCSTMLLRMRPGVLIRSRYTVVKVSLELLMRAYTLPSCNCPCQCCWGSLLRLLFPLSSHGYDLLLLMHGNCCRLQYARALHYVFTFTHGLIFHILSCMVPPGGNTSSAGGSPKLALIGVTLTHPISMAQLSEPSSKEDGGRSTNSFISGENSNSSPPSLFGETLPPAS
jgi:hypothetical protein